MIGVAETSIAAAPMLGKTFTFVRFNSALTTLNDINGTSETDLLASTTLTIAHFVGSGANVP